MPWYKLPHSNLVMWFDQKIPDLKPGKKPRVKAKAVTPADRAIAAAKPYLGAPYVWRSSPSSED